MRWVDDNGLRYLQFPHLAELPGLWHGIFTRQMRGGGKGTISTFNVGLNTGESEPVVIENRRRMIQTTGKARAVYAHQVHGTQVAVWENGREDEDGCLEGDALMTNELGAALVIQTADCQSVMMADPVKRVVANVHSGWRGSVKNIVGKTVRSMQSRFGCEPADILAGIGPSLGPCCAEFKNYKREIPSRYWSYGRSGNLFDFWQLTKDQLADAGVTRKKVKAAGICTRCNTSAFFSYRGEGAAAGRFAAVIHW